MPTTTKDHYQTLGIKRNASAKEIKSAFRSLARKYHPDTNAGDSAAEDRFKDINEAYEVLSDPAERKLYDRYGDDWRAYRDAGYTGDEPRSTGSSRPGSYTRSPGGGSTTTTTFSDDEGFGSIFGSLFGNGTGTGTFRRSPARGQDIEQAIEVSFDEAFRGTQRRFDIQTPDTCPVCHGEGLVRGAICPRCNGSGTTMQSRTIEVTIPAGVTSGQRIRVKGQGGPGTSGGPAGDVFLVVTVRPDPRFQIEGANLRTTIDVPVLDAILGGEATVPTPTGRVALTIPEGTQNGRVFRLRHQGMPRVKGSDRGDLLAVVNVTLPTKLSPDERSLYQQLRDLQRQ
jgi:DnaJ-class molecular chaperone